MKRFKFPLEPLRVLRQQRERAAQLLYAKTLAVCKKAEIQLQSADGELEAAWSSLGGELNANATASRLLHLRTWCTVLEIRWHERKAALAEARRVADLAFQEMIAAMRDREALDCFHDKALLAHDREIQREEQKNFDEMAAQSGPARGLLQLSGLKNVY
jgi:flagellar export protein FliJ